ncbi:hypothetical protein M409DRAFT_68757 [Zasmidium cellare ATCC 36951]|uniref:Rhodopsin domain-containing protein n=1 Tax=Zasmidium cellare ATCC 36951 TaxID=1080233 RepID=A0A6A6C8K2_ZASCE|nr:uncharacterized protein M409DRAFT_68757 [Zasmidium cellare ATCC 36951]KAF2163163.1 hypothetical protein M409DRAFT_68757 [Zasmidium cellare ATCC 36951]
MLWGTSCSSAHDKPILPFDGNHRGAGIHICNGFGLTVILITLAIRAYIRTRVAPPWTYDDHALAAATILATIQCLLVFVEVSGGFGTSLELLNPEQLLTVQRLGYAADIFYVLSIYAGKISVVLLFKRIIAERMHQIVAWSIFGGCCVMGFISIFLSALRCDVSQPWLQFEKNFPSLAAQWSAVAAFDIVTELSLFFISILLVHGLHTKAKNKGRVVLAFGIRLPIIAIIIIRLIYLKRELQSPDPTLDGVPASILTQVEIFYNIITATVPCLRPFLAGFATNFGAIGSGTVLGGSQIGTGSKNSHSNSKSGSFALSSLTSRNRISALKEKIIPTSTTQSSRSHDVTGEDDSWRPDPSNNETTVTRGNSRLPGNDASSIASDESTKMIIKKEVQFSVGSVREHGAQHLGVPDEVGRASQA